MNLEKSLNEIQDLKHGLSAENVVKEEKGHYEEVARLVGGGPSYDKERVYEDEWVIDEPRFSLPDQDKRTDARRKLKDIYDADGNIILQYAAGNALSIQKDELDEKVKTWAEKVKYQLDSSDKKTGSDVLEDAISLYKISKDENALEIINKISQGKDEEISSKAKRYLSLYDKVKNSKSPKFRSEWCHEEGFKIGGVAGLVMGPFLGLAYFSMDSAGHNPDESILYWVGGAILGSIGGALAGTLIGGAVDILESYQKKRHYNNIKEFNIFNPKSM